MEPNWTSIVPPVLAVVLAFATRDAIVSLVIACLAGVMLLGQGPQGFPDLITRALGTEDFIWIAAVEVFIGVLVAFLQRSGAIELFRQRVSRWVSSRRQVGLLGWSLGLFVFFSDYFSPLFVGAVMRNITDSYRISREKLAYICDLTSACVSVMIPISAWAVYLSGLAVVALELEGVDAGMRLFLASLPYNFYAFLTIVMVGAIASEWLPDFGPMRAAEDRARQTGKVLRDGANPMMGRELTDLEASASPNASIWLNFIFPVALIIGTNVATFAMTGAASVLDSLMVACLFLGCVMWLQRLDTLQGIMQSAMAGIKGVMPAVIILSLAYCINTLSRDLQTATFVVNATESWMSPTAIPALAFVISAFISFSTGTSWGTYAIMIPIALPLAAQFTGEPFGSLVLVSFAAVAGGGVFGDHCSPLSDTTVLSSLGSASDHIDHTRTQLPYAVAVGLVALVLYLVVGTMVA